MFLFLSASSSTVAQSTILLKFVDSLCVVHLVLLCIYFLQTWQTHFRSSLQLDLAMGLVVRYVHI